MKTPAPTLTEADRRWFQRQLQPMMDELARLRLRADEILTADETAPMCGYENGDALLRAIRDKRCGVPSMRQGKLVVFLRGDVVEYMAKHRRNAGRVY